MMIPGEVEKFVLRSMIDEYLIRTNEYKYEEEDVRGPPMRGLELVTKNSRAMDVRNRI